MGLTEMVGTAPWTDPDFEDNYIGLMVDRVKRAGDWPWLGPADVRKRLGLASLDAGRYIEVYRALCALSTRAHDEGIEDAGDAVRVDSLGWVLDPAPRPRGFDRCHAVAPTGERCTRHEDHLLRRSRHSITGEHGYIMAVWQH